ncbi:spindle assembly checkpoint component Mad1p [Monosporozyma servazzii]
MSESGEDGQYNDTGRSSPFVDTPSNGIEEHDITSENIRDKIDSVDTPDSKLNSLRYKVDTQRNEFELELLQLQRKYSDLERIHSSTLEELESSSNKIQKIKYEENKLLEEIDSWQKKYHRLENKLGDTINQLTSDVKEKERLLTERQLENSVETNRLQSDVDNNKITIDNLKASLNRYEDTIKEQTKEIVALAKGNDIKNDEIVTLKQQLASLSPKENITGSPDITKSNHTEELTTINRLFQDQIKYTTELEETNLKQAEKIKLLEGSSNMITFWKSEVDSLQHKLQGLESLENDYKNTQLELIELKSKLAEWEILQDQNFHDNNDDDNKTNKTDFNASETLRELTLIRKENLILIENNDKLNSSNNNLKILNEELAMERNQLLDLNKNYENNIINLKRLNHEYEQQKILISEECKLLRNQLSEYTNFGKTDTEINKDLEDKVPQNGFNNGGIQAGLENLVDDYKNKTDDLTNELKKLNEQMLATTAEEQNKNKKKRKLADSSQTSSLTYYSQRINELQIENAKLSRDLGKYVNLNKLLDEKLKRLIMLKEKKIRILELRDNPLANDQFVKQKQLQLIKQENEDLLKTLQKSVTDLETVPLSVVKSMEFDLKQGEKEIYKCNKRFTRLKEIFNKKSLEFIEVVNSILGFKLEFQQNNKVKIYSCFRPDKYLVVDLVKNTLVSNLNLDNWDELLSSWIEQREQIPCFLASITLQLWQDTLN